MNRDDFRKLLACEYIEASDRQLEQLDRYFELLVEWNSFMNLTGITEYDEVLIKHFLDSGALKLAVTELAKEDASWGEEFNSLKSVIDVGTGAGFPGLPIKILFPEYSVTLLDSLNKRINFLNEVVSQLELEDIVTIHARAEDGAKDKQLRECFDIGVSRAVANLSTLCEYVLPYVRVGGYFVAYKSGAVDEERDAAKKAISVLGGELVKEYRFTLPSTDMERSLLFIKKIKPTPKKYPRKAGLPGKEPIV